MLEWPKKVTDTAQRVLDLFKHTSIAEELSEDTRAWRVASWSWTEDPPVRVIARTEKGEEVACYFDRAGGWTVTRS